MCLDITALVDGFLRKAAGQLQVCKRMDLLLYSTFLGSRSFLIMNVKARTRAKRPLRLRHTGGQTASISDTGFPRLLFLILPLVLPPPPKPFSFPWSLGFEFFVVNRVFGIVVVDEIRCILKESRPQDVRIPLIPVPFPFELIYA